ncbi:MAG: T9SS type A sorting domain-containing protein [Candidatus Eisenbacteria bacterium]
MSIRSPWNDPLSTTRSHSSARLLLTPLFALSLLLAAPANDARAEFTLVEDFENLSLGPIDEQGGWQATSSTSVVALDPIWDVNQVLSITTDSSNLHRELLVTEGTKRMLFFRFRLGSQLSASFGMSDLFSPDRFDHFEAELSVTNAPTELRVNDDGTYRVLTPLSEEEWYSCWVHLDTEADQLQVWMHKRDGMEALPSDKLSDEELDVFGFRNGGSNDLRTFYVKTGGGQGVVGPLYIDDIYLEDTEEMNLEYPYFVPAGLDDADAAPSQLVVECRPNPFHGSTALRFQLSEPGPVDLSVFDTSGRRVAQVANGRLDAREHEFHWQGEDRLGRPVSAGLYLVRLKTTQSEVTERLVLVR